MVKIERVLDGAVATVTRSGEELQLFQGQLINYHDLETLKVIGGKLVYSIDETEVVEVIGVPAKPGAPVTKEVEDIVKATETEVVEVVETPAPVVTKKK